MDGKRKKEADWTICGKAGWDGEPAIATSNLPQYIDGFFRLYANDESLVVTGRTSRVGRNKILIGLMAGKGENLLILSLPLIQFRYPNKKLDNGQSLNVNLLGQVLFNLNLFALWEVNGEPVGWTEEVNAKACGAKRKLSKGDLLPDYFKDSFAQLDNEFRKVIQHEMGL